jgi:hypothetical protein
MSQNLTLKDILLIGALILVAYFGYQNRTMKIELEDVSQTNLALKDTLIKRKTKDGLNVAKIAVLESYSTKYLLDLATKDSTIVKLQSLVKKYKKNIKKQGSVTVIGTEAKIDTLVPTKVLDSTTTVDNIIYPIYEAKFNLKGWVWGKVKASSDSTSVSIKFREEINAIIGQEKTGFLGLGKKKTFVEVILHNPYNEVKSLRTYLTKAPPRSKFIFGPTLSYGIGPGGTPGVFLGIGVTIPLIRF